MLTVTASACQQLTAIREKNNIPQNHTLRLLMHMQRLKLTADTKNSDDQVITHDDEDLLVLDADTAEALQESTLDCRENQLVITS